MVVKLTPEGKRAWIEYHDAHGAEQAELTGDLAAAWSKLEGYAARLALVVHLTHWAAGRSALTDSGAVDEASMSAGVALSEWFKSEVRRIYAMLSESDEDSQCRQLVELVRRKGGSATPRDLMRSSQKYAKAPEAELALAELVEAGLGRWEDVPTTSKGGRPTCRFVLADTVDVDTTPKSPEKSKVSSTEPAKATVQPVAAPAAPPPSRVDTTPKYPKESGVLSTSTPSTRARKAHLDPDRPGPIELLAEEQRRRYRAVYSTTEGKPSEKHAAAWRAALTEGRPWRASFTGPSGESPGATGAEAIGRRTPRRKRAKPKKEPERLLDFISSMV